VIRCPLGTKVTAAEVNRLRNRAWFLLVQLNFLILLTIERRLLAHYLDTILFIVKI